MTPEALAHNPLYASRALLAVAFVGLVAFELVFRAVRWRKRPSLPTTATNTFMWVVEGLVRGGSVTLRWVVFSWVARLAPVHVAASLASGAIAYVLIDFVYYWKHRLFHETELGWALHATHHTSTELSFLATFRLNWIEAFLSYYFFLPLALLGLDPLMLLFLIEINDAWQVVCHTEIFGRVPLWERVFNHPDYHRVHHSRDRARAGCNYTSTLILWDRLFGTYHRPEPTADCGVDDQPETFNPFELQLGPLFRLVRSRVRRYTAANNNNPTRGPKQPDPGTVTTKREMVTGGPG